VPYSLYLRASISKQLGLALDRTKKLRYHRQTKWVEVIVDSRPDQFTGFLITLPRKIGDEGSGDT
jgi:hypothetical protein